MPVTLNLVYYKDNVNVDKFTGNEPWSVVNANIYLQFGGAGAVSVLDFEEKLQFYFQGMPPRPSSPAVRIAPPH